MRVTDSTWMDSLVHLRHRKVEMRRLNLLRTLLVMGYLEGAF